MPMRCRPSRSLVSGTFPLVGPLALILPLACSSSAGTTADASAPLPGIEGGSTESGASRDSGRAVRTGSNDSGLDADTGAGKTTGDGSGSGAGNRAGSGSGSAGSGSGSGASSSTCAKDASSWVSQSVGSGAFDFKQYGNYVVQADNWGGLPGQVTWANDQNCWGATNTQTTSGCCISSYPHVTRGWMELGELTTLSSPGTNDWTTKSGLGIAVTALTKAKAHWSFDAPFTTGDRWDALQDVYFHDSATPASSEFPPQTDLQIIQSDADQVVNSSTYYALVAEQDHATTVTLGGNTYVIWVDDPGAASFHQTGGHTITMFNTPGPFTSMNNVPKWGVTDAVTDIAAIVKFLLKSNPTGDNGKPLLNAAGATITSPLITSNEFLTAINAGWEIDLGATFTNTAFCVAMQEEPDCP